jgi:GNAT superfamily N-acetyltransferase
MRTYIRKAKMADLDTILKINKALELWTPNPWLDPVWTASEIRKGSFYLAHGAAPQAAMCLVPGDDAYSIETLAVADDARGGGVGRKLVEFATKKAIEGGKPALYVGSYKAFGVRGFYESCGFEVIAVRQLYGRKYWWFEKKTGQNIF